MQGLFTAFTSCCSKLSSQCSYNLQPLKSPTPGQAATSDLCGHLDNSLNNLPPPHARIIKNNFLDYVFKTVPRILLLLINNFCCWWFWLGLCRVIWSRLGGFCRSGHLVTGARSTEGWSLAGALWVWAKGFSMWSRHLAQCGVFVSRADSGRTLELWIRLLYQKCRRRIVQPVDGKEVPETRDFTEVIFGKQHLHPSLKIGEKKVFFLKNDGKGCYQKMIQDKNKSLSFT